MKKDDLYKKPSYAARHPEDVSIQTAINLGQAAAGSAANPRSNQPRQNRMTVAIRMVEDYVHTWGELFRRNGG